MIKYKELFKNKKIEELLREDHPPLIYVYNYQTIEEVNQILNKHNILCVPIFDKEKNQFIGLVDLLDICTFVSFGNTNDEYEKEGIEYNFGTRPIGTLPNFLPKRHKLFIFDLHENIQKAINVMTGGVERILIARKSNDGKPVIHNLISQTDIIKYLLRNQKETNIILNKTIEELNLLKNEKKIIVTTNEKSALEGFRKMYQNNIPSIPVVDKEGKIITSLSASDVRGLTKEKMRSLLLPVEEYLFQIHGERPNDPITANKKDSLHSIIEKALKRKIHRIWIIDENNKPIDDISFTDIIKLFKN